MENRRPIDKKVGSENGNRLRLWCLSMQLRCLPVRLHWLMVMRPLQIMGALLALIFSTYRIPPF